MEFAERTLARLSLGVPTCNIAPHSRLSRRRFGSIFWSASLHGGGGRAFCIVMGQAGGTPLISGAAALSMLDRPVVARLARGIALATLGTVTVAVLLRVHRFGLTRFFTIDEYQWGHATWLVSVGQVPYRDFYEHHLPLGYVLHALFLPADATFIEKAIWFRQVAFGYILVGCVSVAVVEYLTQRNLLSALSCAIVPVSVGFGLMSAIDYRGDNWAAFLLLCCFSTLHANQRMRRRWLAAVAGLLFTAAVLMTQKTLLVGAVALLPMLVTSFWPERGSRPRSIVALRALRVEHPLGFVLGMAIPAAMAVAVLAYHGVLGRAFEITVVQALQHERLYPSFSVWRYVEPYLDYAPFTTAALLACALASIVRSADRFWLLPTVAALLAGVSPKAPFPYNLVLASFLVGVSAVRGYAALIESGIRCWPRLRSVGPLGYLLPLSLVPAQLGFVEGASTNLDQLETLRQIEAYSGPEDAVIDSEGGALFRPHRGYYWYQGEAHARMFADHYQRDLVNDLRASRALFWIHGHRTKQLPAAAIDFLTNHYVRFRGDLHVLGVWLPQNPLDQSVDRGFDVVRSGEYFVACASSLAEHDVSNTRGSNSGLRIDGRSIEAGSVHLDVGAHRARMSAASPDCRLSYLPASAFDLNARIGRHAPLFEYSLRR
jgi:hypothetical protein